MIFNLPAHNRNYRYRPPYKERDSKAGDLQLLKRFFAAYVLPFRSAVAACTLLAAVEHCASFYLLAYYTRTVVDNILVFRPAPAATPARSAADRQDEAWAGRRAEDAPPAPELGLDRRLETRYPSFSRPPDAGLRLGMIFLLYAGTAVMMNMLGRAAIRRRVFVGQHITANLRRDLHEKLFLLSMGYHGSHTPGRLMARVLHDVESIQEQMLTLVIDTSIQMITLVSGVTLLLLISWQMTLLALSVMPLYVLLYRVIRPRLQALSREISHTNACMYGLSAQKFDSMRAIQAYGRERGERLAFHRLAACFFRDVYLQARLSSRAGRVGEIISAVGTHGLVFLYGVRRVLSSTMSVGELLYAHGTTATLFSPILQLSQLNLIVANLLVNLRRVSAILDEPVSVREPKEPKPFPKPVRSGMALRSVSFSYATRPDPVLQDVTLDIPAGEWQCIMGPSGSGKTTLLLLLARLQDPAQGAILVDGTQLSAFSLDDLRRRVALVPQEPQILGGSIRDNICYGWPDAEPRDIIEAAVAAEFHDFVMSLPVKYETLLGEKGTSLSGGQKQRLSLARALLTRPDILLLDDTTSALDAETERRIQDTLSRILVGKTAVIVSQRVSMAMRCHRICMLREGRIAELGTHGQLIAGQGSYARLHAQQTGAEKPGAGP